LKQKENVKTIKAEMQRVHMAGKMELSQQQQELLI
jgi:hypothetical protein